jgi:Sulfotransferase domain
MGVSRLTKRLRYTLRATKLRAPLVWLRHRGLSSNDCFIASYPRSGNTWLRFLSAEYLARDVADFESVDALVPDISQPRTSPLLLHGSTRLFKTHEPYYKPYGRAVYIIRDPRDVVISNYEFHGAHGVHVAENFDNFVKMFVKGKINAFGSWADHIKSWLNSPAAESGNLLFLRYEDMRLHTEEELTRVLMFLGVFPEASAVRRAIENNDLKTMREKEGRVQAHVPHLVRKGHVGAWRERLTPAQVELIENHAGDLLAGLGYVDSRRPVLESLPTSASPFAEAQMFSKVFKAGVS